MAILERDDRNNVAYLTMNAPERLNALSDAMLAELQSAFDALHDDRTIRAVVLSGTGKAFCAGHDLKEMTKGRAADDNGAAYFKNLFDSCAKMMLTIRSLPQPVIAKAHGIATAAGCQLLATCDLAVAAEGTKFGVNGVNIGLFCSTPMVALSRVIPRKKAFEMLTTGQFIETDDALQLGLINRACALDELDSTASELAETISSKLGQAVHIGKEAFYQQIEMPIESAYEYTGDVMVQNLLFKETEAGIYAFLNKQSYEWKQ